MTANTKKKGKTHLGKGTGNMSWDEIGSVIGEKIGEGVETAFDRFDEEDRKEKAKHWFFRRYTCDHGHGGGAGRFIFIVSILYAMHLTGALPHLPLWLFAIIVIGFTLMRF